jgi:hypothetical protein
MKRWHLVFRWPWILLVALLGLSFLLVIVDWLVEIDPRFRWISLGVALGFLLSLIVVVVSGFGAPRFTRVDLFNFTDKGASAKVTTNDAGAPPINVPTAPPKSGTTPGHTFEAAPAGSALADGVTTVTVEITWDGATGTPPTFPLHVIPVPPNSEEYAYSLTVRLKKVGGVYKALAGMPHAVDESEPTHVTSDAFDV